MGATDCVLLKGGDVLGITFRFLLFFRFFPSHSLVGLVVQIETPYPS